ncbi:hypothetical protein PBY51_013725 [Eleginops maclovinus]|uniref:Uncharacterized protein n=1 Tax=Eleginops maclovinus TaxID=56733 RepID=A0AAN7Y774_ELEMC|nr:hypothetical protein PBY51_013725 [Eleginops maclovinus]
MGDAMQGRALSHNENPVKNKGDFGGDIGRERGGRRAKGRREKRYWRWGVVETAGGGDDGGDGGTEAFSKH